MNRGTFRPERVFDIQFNNDGLADLATTSEQGVHVFSGFNDGAFTGEQIYDVITHFAKQGKVFNVHFRNIVGGLGNFHEAFIDDGDVDMTRALQCYRDAGYKYMVMPDHVPSM